MTDDDAAIITVKADKHKVNQITAILETNNTTQLHKSVQPQMKSLVIQLITTGRRNLITAVISVVKEATMLTNVPTRNTDGNNQFYSNATYPPTSKVLTSFLDGTVSSQIITASQPPKVVQTIMFEGQLSATVWNILLTQLSQTQNENKQMKQFVKNYIPYNKRNQGNNNKKQTNQQNKSNTATSQNQAKTGSEPKPKCHTLNIQSQQNRARCWG